MSAVLSVRHLNKRYGGRPVLNDVSFDIEEGEFFVVYGPSGVGKTTLLKLIAGLDEPDSGQVWLDDRCVNELEPDERNVAMTFQTYALYPHLTAFENIASPLCHKKRGLSRQEVERRVYEVARLLGIEAVLHHRPAQLSGGQRQRVSLARSLVRHYRILLLDSPLAHVDAKVRHEMRGELKRLTRETHSTILYVTHDYMEALSLGDRIAILKDGVIQQIGTAQQIYLAPATAWIARSIGQPPINILAARFEDSFLLLGEGSRLPLPGNTGLRPAMVMPGRALQLGVRPEYFTVASSGVLKGRIRLCQWLGTRTILNVEVEGLPELAVAYWGFAAWPVGTPIGLDICWERALWFEAASGRNIFVDEGAMIQ
jgi:multiple sugar transport system ATP-binding protein